MNTRVLILSLIAIALLVLRKPLQSGAVMIAEKITARGIRNNNPGNIREAPGDKTKWIGERATDDDPAFEEFISPQDGIRALAKVLLNYQTRYGLNSVRQLITRWAPPTENITDAYVKAVASAARVGPDDAVDLHAKPEILQRIVTAIIKHENGVQPYSTAMIATSVKSAYT